ncbi:4Fe-4S ferredoxin iron-sulfur binding domain-containing protein [Alistipes sp. CAG:831]|nr:4Fe-4S ferredoxin iron-sulfur binding domain-containing protein [Alistipes sp. CAG:831]
MDNTSQTITVICFSPTHTSRAIAGAVADGMARTRCGAGATASCPSIVRTLDLTLDRSDEPIILTSGETVVLGAPVYAGRVAPEAVRRLKRIQVAAGASIPAIVTVTYGNRDYEDALVELYDLALSLGLTPFAAGAFIGEHSYSTPAMPIAEGRPDSMDLADASIFGGECARKLESPGAFAPFHIKGNRPYKEPSRPASSPAAAHPSGSGTAAAPPAHSAVTASPGTPAIPPVHSAVSASSGTPTVPSTAATASPDRPAVPAVPVTADGCPLCGECAAVCPTGAIVLDSGSMKVLTDPSLCIRCCACVKACPAGMRTYSTPFAAFLHEHCSARREPETFL